MDFDESIGEPIEEVRAGWFAVWFVGFVEFFGCRHEIGVAPLLPIVLRFWRIVLAESDDDSPRPFLRLYGDVAIGLIGSDDFPLSLGWSAHDRSPFSQSIITDRGYSRNLDFPALHPAKTRALIHSMQR